MEIVYTKLNIDDKKFDIESESILKEVLSVFDYNHKIIICHPNIAYNSNIINKDNPDFKEIDWDKIDENFKVDETNSYIGFLSIPDEAWNYVQKRFNTELFQNDERPRHLIIIEQDQYSNLLVRCILKDEKKEIFIAINPKFETYRPKDTYDKQIRSMQEINIKEYFSTRNKSLLFERD